MQRKTPRRLTLIAILASVVPTAAACGYSKDGWSAVAVENYKRFAGPKALCASAEKENPSEPNDFFKLVICTDSGKSYTCWNTAPNPVNRQAFGKDCEHARDAVRRAEMIP